MRDLDETDLEILQLLLADARRPYSDIAEAVGLSAPAVSDRVDRLQETGVLERFTLDLDRSQLSEGVSVLIDLTVAGGGPSVSDVRDALLEDGAVEHVFTTAAGDLVAHARVRDTDVAGWLAGAVGPAAVADVRVRLLSGADWTPDLGDTAFALDCAECGNTVDAEGTAARVGGDLYQFCCPSCEARFTERYADLEEGVD